MRTRRAFSLVEMLVVLAIIFALASLLMPMLGRVREKARRVVCASNLRQLAMACRIYASDFGDRLPAQEDTPCTWDFANSVNPVWINSLRAYVLNRQKSVFICPSSPQVTPTYGGYPTKDSDSNLWYNGQASGKHMASIRNQGVCVLIDEWAFRSGCTGTRPYTYDSCPGGGSCPITVDWGNNHTPNEPYSRKAANWAFVDGHVEWQLFDAALANWVNY